MRKFQKVTACIMAAALAATGCSGAGGAKAPEAPAKTEAAGTQADSGTQEDSGAQAAASGEEEPVLVVYTARSEALNNAVIPDMIAQGGGKIINIHSTLLINPVRARCLARLWHYTGLFSVLQT